VVFGIFLGIVGAMGRTSKSKLFHGIATAYVELFRNTPFLVQIYFAYFALPTFNIDLTPGQSALLVMILNTGAYMSEIIRAGIEAVHKSRIRVFSGNELPTGF
jgi:polar amino acid transport system permease protein